MSTATTPATTATATTTVKDLLLPAGAEPPPELRQQATKAAKDRGVEAALARLTAIGLDILGARIGHVVGDVLNADLGGIIGSALTKNQKILAATAKTQNDPKAEEVVPLADQKLESTYDPSVDVVVDGKTVISIPFQVVLEAKIEGGLVVVKGGEIAAVRSGRGTLTATLKCEGVQVAQKKADFELAGILRAPSADTSATRGAAGPVVAGSAASAPAHVPAPAPTPAAASAPPPLPPVGFIQDGWRFTASGQWEPVGQFRPGDIVNGHRLNAAGNRWEPLPPR